MSWEGFQDMEEIGIEDPTGVVEDDDDRDRNQGKIQKNLDEREENLGFPREWILRRFSSETEKPNP